MEASKEDVAQLLLGWQIHYRRMVNKAEDCL